LTRSSASDGAKFFQTLVDSERQLTSITIEGERNWFVGTDECMGPLLTFLAKQTGLRRLGNEYNELSEAQEL